MSRVQKTLTIKRISSPILWRQQNCLQVSYIPRLEFYLLPLMRLSFIDSFYAIVLSRVKHLCRRLSHFNEVALHLIYSLIQDFFRVLCSSNCRCIKLASGGCFSYGHEEVNPFIRPCTSVLRTRKETCEQAHY